MTRTERILKRRTIEDLDDYRSIDGVVGCAVARQMNPDDVIDLIGASGLRGRGGGGFPTGTKWRTVAEMRSSSEVSVVVNGAEGEPGSYKDRAILRNDPYQVIDGALIASHAVGAREVVIAVKEHFDVEIRRLRAAIAEMETRLALEIPIRLVTGPSSYLFGEESAMLEVIEGRPPLPRVSPPYRRGLGDASGDQNATNDAQLAGDEGLTGSPAVVNNVETFANAALVVRRGIDDFRSVGTEATPGTAVCTISGAVEHHGVAEFAMGTPLWEVVDTLGGGPLPGRTLVAAISGTANPAITADRFDTPLCFDHFAEVGSGLGASGFIVFDDQTDFSAVAHGVARFLAVESCGQCEPCKFDGGAIAERLDALRRSDVDDVEEVSVEIGRLMTTVADGARCGLAAQHQSAVASLHELASRSDRSHDDGSLAPAAQELVAPIIEIDDGRVVLDRSHLDKQPDWTMSGGDSGKSPADRL